VGGGKSGRANDLGWSREEMGGKQWLEVFFSGSAG